MLKMAVLFLAGLAVTVVLCCQSCKSHKFTNAERRQMGLQSLSKAAPHVQWDAKSVTSGAIACDGGRDNAYLGRGKGNVYVGLVRTTKDGPEILEFAVDPGRQDAICAEPATLAVESLDYDPEGDVAGFQRSKVCKGLVLNDSQCDPIHIFWNRSTRHLSWWRE